MYILNAHELDFMRTAIKAVTAVYRIVDAPEEKIDEVKTQLQFYYQQLFEFQHHMKSRGYCDHAIQWAVEHGGFDHTDPLSKNIKRSIQLIQKGEGESEPEREAAKTPPTVLEETLRLIPVDKIANIEISVGADGFTTVDVEMKRTPTDGNTMGAVYYDEHPVFTTLENFEDDVEEEIPIEKVDHLLSTITRNTGELTHSFCERFRIDNHKISTVMYKEDLGRINCICKAAMELKELLLYPAKEETDNDRSSEN